MKKRIVSLLCTVALLAAMLPISAFAVPSVVDGSDIPTSGQCGENLYWEFDTNTGTLTISGTGAMEDYTKEQGAPWSSCVFFSGPKTLVIQNGVTHIGNYAFADGSEFRHFNFQGELCIPDSVRSIGENAFFYSQGFTGDLILPDGITEIGAYAFALSNFDGVLHLPDDLSVIGERAFWDCKGLNGNLVLPDGITDIGVEAFQTCNFTGELVIPGSVSMVGDRAFQYCNGITEAYLSDGITTLGNAFLYCSGLKRVTIPSSVQTIDTDIFYGCDNLAELYYTGSEAQWNAIGGKKMSLPASVVIHFSGEGGAGSAESGLAEALLLVQDEQTGEIKLQGVGRPAIPDTIDQDMLQAQVDRYVWVTYDSPAHRQIMDIQPLESYYGTVTSMTENSLIIDGQLFPYTFSILFPEMYVGQDVVCHVLNGTAVALAQPMRRTGTLENWTNTEIVIDGFPYPTGVLTDPAIWDDLERLRGWEVDYLTLSDVLLRVEERADAEMGKVGRFVSYDAATRFVRFADQTSYPLADGVTIDFAGLEGRWVRYTLRNASNTPQITGLSAVQPTVRVQVILGETQVEYRDGEMRIPDGTWMPKADFRIPVTIMVENATRLDGVPVTELVQDDTLRVTLEKVELTAPDGFSFGGFDFHWFTNQINLGGSIALRPGEIWYSNEEGIAGFLTVDRDYQPDRLTASHTVSAQIVVDGETHQTEAAFTVTDCSEGASSGIAQTQWETAFLTSLYQTKDLQISAVNAQFRQHFSNAKLQEIGRIVALWGAVMQPDLAKEASGTLPACLQIQTTMDQGSRAGHEATLVFQYVGDTSQLGNLFQLLANTSAADVSFGVLHAWLIDNTVGNTPRAVILDAPYQLTVGASASQFANGLKNNLQAKYGDSWDACVEKLVKEGILKEVHQFGAGMFQKVTGIEFVNDALDVALSFGEVVDATAVPTNELIGKFIFNNTYQVEAITKKELDELAETKHLDIQCPVDVFVYNPAGELCGAIENNIVTTDTLETFLSVDGDRKSVWVSGADYRIRLVATDTGTMDYFVTEYLGGSQTRVVSFDDVPLQDGLEYQAAVPSEKDVPAQSYALTSNTDEVIYADRDTRGFVVTFDGNGGTMQEQSETYRTDPAGKLVSWPDAPVRNGYVFGGWYTQADGGSKVDAAHVFRADTTLYAYWYRSGNGSSSGGSTGTFAISVATASHGSVSVSPTRAKKGTTVTVTIQPDAGYTTDRLTVTQADGDTISVSRKTDTRYTFVMPGCNVEVKAIFAQAQTSHVGSFIDVPASAYYEDAVRWAVEKGITTGTDATHFDPDQPCTRAQMVLFLWRAYGSPRPTIITHPFKDVRSSADFYIAMLWAVERGITFGDSTTLFAPEKGCTRAQAVTFLHRAAGKPVASGKSVFVDVKDDAYYADAVNWANGRNITAGTDAAAFSPETICSRAEMATFLYRAMA